MRRHPSWLKTKVHGEALKPHTITTAPADAVLAVRQSSFTQSCVPPFSKSTISGARRCVGAAVPGNQPTVDAAYLGSQVSFARLCLLACSVRPEHLNHAAAGISKKKENDACYCLSITCWNEINLMI